MDLSSVCGSGYHNAGHSQCATLHVPCTLAMITTLMTRPQTDMPHLRVVPYKERVTIVQIQMSFTQLDAPSAHKLLV